jgi:hypothetical protein
MATRVVVPLLILGLASASAQAGVKGTCSFKGKNLVFVDGVAAMAPDPFEKTKKIPQLWFMSVALPVGALAGKKPDEFDDVLTEHSFDKDSTSLELRLDQAGTLVEMLQLYVPPGTSQSMSSNEVGKLTLKAPIKARATGSWTLADDDMKCNLSFDLVMGATGPAAPAPKPWGTPLPAGGGEPGKVYMAMHRATLAGDVDAMLKMATKERAGEMQKARKEPEFAGMLEMIKAFEPAEVQVVSGQANAQKAELIIAGKDSDGSSMTGTANLVMEGGAWRIEKVETKSKSK